jgi:hypothetical protein
MYGFGPAGPPLVRCAAAAGLSIAGYQGWIENITEEGLKPDDPRAIAAKRGYAPAKGETDATRSAIRAADVCYATLPELRRGCVEKIEAEKAAARKAAR